MKILVAGAAGFIGSNYVRRQLSDAYPETAGAHFTVLDKLTYAGTLINLTIVADSPRYRFVQGDVCDAGPGRHDRLVPRQRGLVAAAEGSEAGAVSHPGAPGSGPWLVVGAAGILGHDLTEVISAAGLDVVGVDLPAIDITDPGSVESVLDRVRPAAVRTAWLYGVRGANFVKTMLSLEASRPTLSVVDDQRGQPTWSRDLARQIVALVEADAPAGVYHGTSSGQTTWFGLTREIFRLVGADPQRVAPTTTEQFPRPAPRPAYSVLGHDRWAAIGLAPIRSWSDALAEALPLIVAGLAEDSDR